MSPNNPRQGEHNTDVKRHLFSHVINNCYCTVAAMTAVPLYEFYVVDSLASHDGVPADYHKSFRCKGMSKMSAYFETLILVNAFSLSESRI